MNSKKTRQGYPPPQNPNRLNLIHEDNTLVASIIVKLQRRRSKLPSAEAAKYPPTEGQASNNIGDKASALGRPYNLLGGKVICQGSRYDNSGKSIR